MQRWTIAIGQECNDLLIGTSVFYFSCFETMFQWMHGYTDYCFENVPEVYEEEKCWDFYGWTCKVCGWYIVGSGFTSCQIGYISTQMGLVYGEKNERQGFMGLTALENVSIVLELVCSIHPMLKKMWFYFYLLRTIMPFFFFNLYIL